MGPPPAKQRFHKQQAWKAEINVPGKAPLPLRSKYTKQGEIGIYLKQGEARACDSTLVHAKDSPLSCNDTKSSIWLKMKKAMGHVYSLLHGTCRHRTIGGIRDGWGINKATRSNPLPFPCNPVEICIPAQWRRWTLGMQYTYRHLTLSKAALNPSQPGILCSRLQTLYYANNSSSLSYCIVCPRSALHLQSALALALSCQAMLEIMWHKSHMTVVWSQTQVCGV